MNYKPTGRVNLRKTKQGLTWFVIINLKKKEDGTYPQKFINTHLPERANKKKAEQLLEIELAKYEEELRQIEFVPNAEQININNDILFVDYLKEYVNKKKFELKPLVFETYIGYVDKISSFFNERKNNILLKEVKAKDINDFYFYLREKGLKAISLKHYACVLRPAFRQAYLDELIPNNQYDKVNKIKKDLNEEPIREYLTEEEMKDFIKTIQSHKLGNFFILDLLMGLRRSELLGLRWDSIDFEKKTITVKDKVVFYDGKVEVSEKLKTRASYRTLPLIKEVEDMLIKIKERTNQNKIDFGNCYNHDYDDFIFVDDLGMIRRADYLTHEFKKLLEKNNLKHIRFHDLRHSCASLLVANGIPIKQIQEWLGHANFGTTADIYSHLDFNSKKESANTLKDVFTFSSPEEQKEKPQAKVESFIDNFNDEELDRLAELLEKRKRKKEQDSEM